MLGIVIIVYNIPSDLFLLQMECIRKFCTDEYEINIIDNSTDRNRSEAIRYHCNMQGIKWIKTASSSYDGSDSHSFAANLSYLLLKDDYTHMAYFDHDLFPVKPFSCIQLLDGKLMAGLGQSKEKVYFWPGCFMFNNSEINQNLLDFSPNSQFSLDTGGNLHILIEEFGEKECVFFNEEYQQNPEFTGKYNYYATINNGTFIHFIGSSNWMNLPDNTERINSLMNIVRKQLDNENSGV